MLMRITVRTCCFLMIALFGLAPMPIQFVALAQSDYTGAISGLVKEVPSDEKIAGATVTFVNEDTGLKRATLTDKSGKYYIAGLPPGDYSLSASKQGYEPDPNST